MAGLTETFNRGVAPDIINAIGVGAGYAREAGSWLVDQFNAADPEAQKWVKAGLGYIGGIVASNWLSKLPGFDMLGGGIMKQAVGILAGAFFSGYVSGPAAAATTPVADPAAALQGPTQDGRTLDEATRNPVPVPRL